MVVRPHLAKRSLFPRYGGASRRGVQQQSGWLVLRTSLCRHTVTSLPQPIKRFCTFQCLRCLPLSRLSLLLPLAFHHIQCFLGNQQRSDFASITGRILYFIETYVDLSLCHSDSMHHNRRSRFQKDSRTEGFCPCWKIISSFDISAGKLNICRRVRTFLVAE